MITTYKNRVTYGDTRSVNFPYNTFLKGVYGRYVTMCHPADSEGARGGARGCSVLPSSFRVYSRSRQFIVSNWHEIPRSGTRPGMSRRKSRRGNALASMQHIGVRRDEA